MRIFRDHEDATSSLTRGGTNSKKNHIFNGLRPLCHKYSKFLIIILIPPPQAMLLWGVRPA